MKIIRSVTAMLFATIILALVFTGCAKKVEKKETKVGDTIVYGSYEQDNNTANGKEQISWEILALENGKALLISEKILDTKPYNEENVNITWELCTLRTWLNKDFFNNSFSATEQTAIVATTVINKEINQNKISGGKDTNDKVFLLSKKESEKYFASNKARVAQGTDFAKSNGLYLTANSDKVESGLWWLRSPGHVKSSVGIVDNAGTVGDWDAYYTSIGVRPAIWITL
ncbi:MAG: DUF6273 domain-containing protein [Eubacteriales bacterium]